jgi:hypothetical protein
MHRAGSNNRMCSPIHVTGSSILILLVITAGCAQTLLDRPGPATPNVASPPGALHSPSPEEVSRYIQMYPLRDIRVGEHLVLNGITCIPEGGTIGIEFYSDERMTRDSQVFRTSCILNRTGLSEGA